MFTGIVETIGRLIAVEQDGGNVHLDIASDISPDLKIDQSVAHNGVCLTVVACDQDQFRVTAIAETLLKSNIGNLKPGAEINLERCLLANARFDGHIVQGHVDTKGVCTKVVDDDGSWRLYFSHAEIDDFLTVHKGSITVNGVSLTVVDSTPESFSVAVIPYTYAHTNFHSIAPGDEVNLEFDIVGKYVREMMRRGIYEPEQ